VTTGASTPCCVHGRTQSTAIIIELFSFLLTLAHGAVDTRTVCIQLYIPIYLLCNIYVGLKSYSPQMLLPT
jgi:hypothetical protein